MDEDKNRPKRPSCGCMLLAVLPLAILLIFFIVIIVRAAAAAM